MKISIYPIVIGVLLVFCSCSKLNHEYTIAFDNKVVIEEFPIVEKCDSGEIVDFNTIGNREIKIIDSIAVLSTGANKGAWKVVSLTHYSVLGEMIDAGNAPHELTVIPMLSQASFLLQNNRTILSVPDNMTHRWHNIDLEKVISGQQDYDSITPDYDIDNFTIYKGLYHDNIEYKITVNPAEGNIIRHIATNNQAVSSTNLEWLNHFSVDKPEKLGLLMPTVALSPSRKMIAEVYNLYPQINIYSISDNRATTITQYGKIADYKKYLGKSSETPQPIYRGVRGYEDFFVVNKIGENESTELQFFDWDGNPLVAVTIPSTVTSFDINFNSGTLLTVDFTKDIIKKYDISHILSQLNFHD